MAEFVLRLWRDDVETTRTLISHDGRSRAAHTWFPTSLHDIIFPGFLDELLFKFHSCYCGAPDSVYSEDPYDELLVLW
jgi:hypothetical protein